jgi:hypothetical protein
MISKRIPIVMALAIMTSIALNDLVRHGIVKSAFAGTTQVESPDTAIRLVVLNTKSVYRVGDAVEVILLLENASRDRTYFVGKTIYTGDIETPLHYLDFALTDQQGRPVRLFDGASVEDPTIRFGPDRKPISSERPTMAELVTKEYVQIGPGSVYGVRARFYKPAAKSGNYRLSATYHETEASKRSPSEIQALPFPVWTKSISSNTVEITVVR